MIGYWLLGGLLLGGFFGVTQWYSVRRLDPQRAGSGVLTLVGGALLRWLAAAALIVAAAQSGLTALLGVGGGFWLARWLFLLWINRY